MANNPKKKTIVKNFSGHSGAIINLVENEHGLVVEKTGIGIDRNHSRMVALNGKIPQPYLISYDTKTLIMSYVPNMDMMQYLINEDTKTLIRFIQITCNTLASIVYHENKDYLPIYEKRLHAAKWLPAPIDEIIDVLPRYLPATDYHGDLTMQNILYAYRDAKFMLIDGVDVDLDTMHFDLSKLRQDLDCGWFLRNTTVNITNRLYAISTFLSKTYNHYDNNAMVILALLRVWNHSNETDKNWLQEQMEKLWKMK